MPRPVKPSAPRPRRAYDATKRRQRAEETAARILEAARRLFRQQGYVATSLAQIARAAGVSVETIYVRIGPKRALLSTLVAVATAGAALDDLIAQAAADPSPRARLQITARLARRIYEASWDVVEVMRAASGVEPEVAAAWREADAHARAAQAPLVQAMVERGQLRTDLGPSEAADVVWALTGPDVYRLLVVESGWTGDRYEGWLARSLASLLLDAASSEA